MENHGDMEVGAKRNWGFIDYLNKVQFPHLRYPQELTMTIPKISDLLTNGELVHRFQLRICAMCFSATRVHEKP